MQIIKFVTLISFIFCSFYVRAQKVNEKVVYKYKQYQRFDLGDLEVKGKIIAPGDITVQDRKRKVFSERLYQRKNFSKRMIQEIKYLR